MTKSIIHTDLLILKRNVVQKEEIYITYNRYNIHFILQSIKNLNSSTSFFVIMKPYSFIYLLKYDILSLLF